MPWMPREQMCIRDRGGRDFEILGGAATFCDDIGIVPEAHASEENRGRLNIWCPSVGDYARAQGLANIQNTNFDAMGSPKKYTKKELLPRLLENTALLKKTCLLYTSWNQLTLNQQYRLNMEFLKVAADRGQEILLSANAYSAPRASAFASEINYLLSRGYRIVDEGWRMKMCIRDRLYCMGYGSMHP